MIWTIARKELLANLLTLRLSVALVCAVLLSGLTAFIGSVDYSLRYEAYEQQVREIDEHLDTVTIWANVEPDIIVPPSPLTILSPGIAKNFNTRFDVRLWQKAGGPNWGYGIVDSGFMKTLVQIDFVTVIAIILSFLAIALGYDAVAGEREQGTLRQMLVNPIPRGVLLSGKLLGGCLSLWIPFSASFALAVLIVAANDHVYLTGDDWSRLAGLFLLACLFLAQIFALALAVSTFVSASATALIVCLFGWLVGGVVYLNALPSIVQHTVVEQPWEDYSLKRSDLWQGHWDAINEWQQQNPPPPEAYQITHDAGQGITRYGHPRYYDWRARHAEVLVESALRHEDDSYELLMDNQTPLWNEAYLIDDWALLSPITNFQALSYILSRTTVRDRDLYSEVGIEYRETYFDHLRREGVFGSWAWFTDDPPGQQLLVPEPETVTQDMLRPDSEFRRQIDDRIQHLEEQRARVTTSLDLSGLPPFTGVVHHGWSDTLARMMPGLAILILTMGAALLAATSRFLRYNPA